jgi:hypothetical protein
MDAELYFKNTLYALLEWLTFHFPNDLHINHSKTLLDNAISLSGVKLVILQYISTMYPYIDEVKARNTQFFMHLATENTMGDLGLETKWKSLNEAQREVLWDFIQQITELALVTMNQI